MPPEAEDQVDELDTTQDDLTDGDTDGGEGDEDPDATPTTFAEVAAAMGWKPKDQFKAKREGDKWLPAKEFVAEFNARQRNTIRSNRELKGKLERLEPLVTQLQQKMTGAERADIKRQARELMEAGEYDKAEELFEKAAAPNAEPGEHPALTAFKNRNEWYGVDDDATEYVAFMDGKLAKEAGGVKDPDAHMRKVEAAVKRRFPELFGDAKEKDEEEKPVRRVPLVQRGGNVDRPSSSKITAATLTPSQRRAAETMGVSAKDYADALNQQNGTAA